MIRHIVFPIFMFTVLSVSGKAAEPEDRSLTLKRIQRACEKGILRPKIQGERVKFCACVVRNHAQETRTEELPIVERIYKKQIKRGEPTSTTESVVADFDIEVAEHCLSNFDYRVQKFD